MEFLLILFTCGLSAAIVGKWKGSSALLWFLIGFCLPILGTIAAFLYRFERDEPRRSCPECGRTLPVTNQVCFACGAELYHPDQHTQGSPTR
jgi:hypothetical protein